jgi:hypothetical protein
MSPVVKLFDRRAEKRAEGNEGQHRTVLPRHLFLSPPSRAASLVTSGHSRCPMTTFYPCRPLLSSRTGHPMLYSPRASLEAWVRSPI